MTSQTASVGTFWGIGAGPGPAGYVPLAALDALRQTKFIVFVPRARGAETFRRAAMPGPVSISRRNGYGKSSSTWTPDRSVLRAHYAQLADTIAVGLRAGAA